MKKKAKDVTLTVVPKSKSTSVVLLPPGQASAKSLPVRLLTTTEFKTVVADTLADHGQIECHSRKAAWYALRAGTRLLCLQDTGRGELKKLIDQCKGKEGLSRATIFRYMGFAREFLEESGHLAKKKITDHGAVDTLANGQMTLWEEPEAAKRPDAIGQALQWLNGRSMTEIMRGMSEDASAASVSGGQTFGGKLGNQHASQTTEEQREADRMAQAEKLTNFQTWVKSDVYGLKDKAGNRRTLEEVAAMESPPQTLSLLTPEALTAFVALCDEGAATGAYLLKLYEGHVPVKRKAKK